MRRLRVVFIAPFGVCRRGTTQARVIPLAAALAGRGHEVHVLIPDWDCRRTGLRSYRMGEARVVHFAAPRASRQLVSIQLLRETVRAALALRPHAIHCFKPIGYAGAVALLLHTMARFGGWSGRLAVDTDDLEGSAGWAKVAGRPRWQALLLDWQERQALHSADLITAASRALTERSNRLRAPAASVGYLPNATHLPALPPWRADAEPRQRAPRLLLYTRFNEFQSARGADVLASILARTPRAHLDVVGSGPRKCVGGFFHQLVQSGVGERVTWHGLLAGQRLTDALQVDSVAVWLFDDNPVNRARSPVKLLELLAHGHGVVAEGVGEVCELPPTAARIAPRADMVRLVEDATALLRDGDARRELGRHAREYISTTCTWPHRAATLDSLYYT